MVVLFQRVIETSEVSRVAHDEDTPTGTEDSRHVEWHHIYMMRKPRPRAFSINETACLPRNTAGPNEARVSNINTPESGNLLTICITGPKLPVRIMASDELVEEE